MDGEGKKYTVEDIISRVIVRLGSTKVEIKDIPTVGTAIMESIRDLSECKKAMEIARASEAEIGGTPKGEEQDG